MLPGRLNLREINDRWRKFHADTNAVQPLVERKRIMADGSIKVDYYRKKAMSAGVLTSGLEIIKLYVSAYEKSFQMGFEGLENEMPTLFTNGTLLGKRCGGVSGRTMRTHLGKMKEYGFIDKTFHGSKHDYELWITPKFAFSEAQIEEIQPQKSTENCIALTPQWNNLPDNVAFETTGNKEKEISHVDICGVAMQQGVLPAGEDAGNTTGNILTSNTGPHRKANPAEKEPNRPLAAKKHDTGAGGAAAAKKPAVNPVFLFYIKHFWQYAKAVLYPGEEFTPEEETMAERAIWTGVYGSFHMDWSENEWEKYHDRAIQRVNLAASYYRKHPDKHPPMPYAQWVKGQGYFDAENSRGFRATYDWLIVHENWKQQHKVNDALRRARTDFRLYKQGKAPVRLQKKSPLQLFHFHESKLRKLGKEALDKFYKQHSINQ